MGGSDPANLTPKALKTLVKMKEGPSVTAVIGPAFRDVDSWAGGLADSDKVTFAGGVSNLAELLSSSDAAIISGGMTLFEASCLGVPAIVLCQNESQVKNAVKFHDCGAAISLGLGAYVSEESLMGNLAVLIRDGELRAEMSRSGMSYVDGRGLQRVTSIILNSFLGGQGAGIGGQVFSSDLKSPFFKEGKNVGKTQP
jgi:spore coat polysaccharide biosynthesis predicted glycosyltransferase SpsG